MKQNNNITVIGLTGGIGAGKSTVAKWIQDAFPVEVISTDAVAKEQMEPGGCSYQAVINTFGTSFLNEDRTINRSKLAAIIFADIENVKKINGLTHPAVIEEVLKRIDEIAKQGKKKAVLIESALLFDAKFEKYCDDIWYVDAPVQERIQRLISFRGYEKEKAESIIRQQKMNDYARAHSDFIIDNSDDKSETDVILQVSDRLSQYVNITGTPERKD